LVARTEEFSLLITLELGNPLEETRSKVVYGAEFVRRFREEPARISSACASRRLAATNLPIKRRVVGADGDERDGPGQPSALAVHALSAALLSASTAWMFALITRGSASAVAVGQALSPAAALVTAPLLLGCASSPARGRPWPC